MFNNSVELFLNLHHHFGSVFWELKSGIWLKYYVKYDSGLVQVQCRILYISAALCVHTYRAGVLEYLGYRHQIDKNITRCIFTAKLVAFSFCEFKDCQGIKQ